MNLRIIAAFAQKDIVDAIRNRYLLTALLTPLFVAILFRILLPGLNNQGVMTIVVHDPGSSSWLAELSAIPQMKFVKAGSAEGVAKEVENLKAVGGLALPANFDADVAAGKQPEMVVYLNNKQGLLEQAAFRQLLDRQVLTLVKPFPARLNWIDVNKDEGAQTSGLSLTQMLLPLLILLGFAMTGALVVPLLLVEEKEKRTLDFLLTSPASLTDIIAGKALTGVIYSILIAGVLLAINYKMIGNWPLTSLTVVSGILFVVAVGLFMGSLFQNTMQVNTWASVVLMILLAPSFPSLRVAGVLEKALYLIPTHYFVEALRLSSAGTASPRIWVNVAILLASTMLAFFAAIWALRRQQN